MLNYSFYIISVLYHTAPYCHHPIITNRSPGLNFSAVTHTSLPFLILLIMQVSKPFIVFISVGSLAVVLLVFGVFLYVLGVFPDAETEGTDVKMGDKGKKDGKQLETVADDPSKAVDESKKLVGDKADDKGAKDDKAKTPQEKKIDDKPPVDPLIKAVDDVSALLGNTICNALKTTSFEDEDNREAIRKWVKEELPDIKDKTLLTQILLAFSLSTKSALEKAKAYNSDDKKPLKKAIYAFQRFQDSFEVILIHISKVYEINLNFYGSWGPAKFMTTFGVDDETKSFVRNFLEMLRCFTEFSLIKFEMKKAKANSNQLKKLLPVCNANEKSIQEIDAVLNAS